MGVWGAGSFENDDVMDWLSELDNADSTELLEATLRDVMDGDPNWIEAPECCRAIGAAEVVAALRNAPHPALPGIVDVWIREHQVTLEPTLQPLALAALTRIQGDSELRALWTDADQLDEWLATLQSLERRLQD